MISISIDSAMADLFIDGFPDRLGKEVNEFKDRVGYKLEAESKRAAPAITGNLRRMIIYNPNEMIGSFAVGGASELIAHAEYSKYVHGKPFYTNKIRRRETPFITNAIGSSESFIKREARRMIEKVVE